MPRHDPDDVAPDERARARGLDPTAIRAQPALTTSNGTIWLVVGGVLTAVALGALIPMTTLPPEGVALGAAIAVAVLYLGMVVVRVAVPRGRRRLGILAIGMLLIAAIALVTSIVVASASWEAARALA